MSIECYMTRGQNLSIGQLACTMCKAKTLKGLDFSNSYILPESGHPLHQPSVEIIPIKNEVVDPVVPEVTISRPREIILHREVVLPSSPTSQGLWNKLNCSWENNVGHNNLHLFYRKICSNSTITSVATISASFAEKYCHIININNNSSNNNCITSTINKNSQTR